MKTQQTKHAELGCTDYLQHPWESCPENKPAPNKAQHSQWFGVYDTQGNLRATFDSEPEAYFYIRNRGHVNGGTYKAIESEVQP